MKTNQLNREVSTTRGLQSRLFASLTAFFTPTSREEVSAELARSKQDHLDTLQALKASQDLGKQADEVLSGNKLKGSTLMSGMK